MINIEPLMNNFTIKEFFTSINFTISYSIPEFFTCATNLVISPCQRSKKVL